jgi:hypothetical protein
VLRIDDAGQLEAGVLDPIHPSPHPETSGGAGAPSPAPAADCSSTRDHDSGVDAMT